LKKILAVLEDSFDGLGWNDVVGECGGQLGKGLESVTADAG
jgi:hypothetical protein